MLTDNQIESIRQEVDAIAFLKSKTKNEDLLLALETRLKLIRSILMEFKKELDPENNVVPFRKVKWVVIAIKDHWLIGIR